MAEAAETAVAAGPGAAGEATSGEVAPGGAAGAAASASGYAFDNDSGHAGEQHSCLSAAYDPTTTERLAAAGVGPGWRCLEVGAGGGSVGVWLARRVVPDGWVVVTDVKPVRMPQKSGMAVLRHDIARDPLPEEAFDLVHARLVLMHMPERERVLARLLRTLRPGGLLQLDELDATHAPGLLLPDEAAARASAVTEPPDAAAGNGALSGAAELYARFQRAKLQALRAAGADPAWGARAAEAVRRAGFTDVDPRPHVQRWRADSPGARLQAHHTRHLRQSLITAGMTDSELSRVRDLLIHPGFCACSPAFYTIQARRPPTARL